MFLFSVLPINSNINIHGRRKPNLCDWIYLPGPFTGSTDTSPTLLPFSDHLPADCAGKPAHHCAHSPGLQTPHTHVLFP